MPIVAWYGCGFAPEHPPQPALSAQDGLCLYTP